MSKRNNVQEKKEAWTEHMAFLKNRRKKDFNTLKGMLRDRMYLTLKVNHSGIAKKGNTICWVCGESILLGSLRKESKWCSCTRYDKRINAYAWDSARWFHPKCLKKCEDKMCLIVWWVAVFGVII